jgi:acyl dehydratase
MIRSPFHTEDDAAAANPIFGRLSASGWHTASMTMRMMVDDGFAIGGGAGLGSPGLDELLWLKPVYPGDTLHCETEVLEVRASGRKPHLGAVKSRTTVYNQHDEKVMQQVATVLVRRRDG